MPTERGPTLALRPYSAGERGGGGGGGGGANERQGERMRGREGTHGPLPLKLCLVPRGASREACRTGVQHAGGMPATRRLPGDGTRWQPADRRGSMHGIPCIACIPGCASRSSHRIPPCMPALSHGGCHRRLPCSLRAAGWRGRDAVGGESRRGGVGGGGGGGAGAAVWPRQQRGHTGPSILQQPCGLAMPACTPSTHLLHTSAPPLPALPSASPAARGSPGQTAAPCGAGSERGAKVAWQWRPAPAPDCKPERRAAAHLAMVEDPIAGAQPARDQVWLGGFRRAAALQRSPGAATRRAARAMHAVAAPSLHDFSPPPRRLPPVLGFGWDVSEAQGASGSRDDAQLLHEALWSQAGKAAQTTGSACCTAARPGIPGHGVVRKRCRQQHRCRRTLRGTQSNCFDTCVDVSGAARCHASSSPPHLRVGQHSGHRGGDQSVAHFVPCHNLLLLSLHRRRAGGRGSEAKRAPSPSCVHPARFMCAHSPGMETRRERTCFETDESLPPSSPP